MHLFKKLKLSILIVAVSFISLVILPTVTAQSTGSWQGTASDNVKVYIDPSSTSRMVTILTRGVHVTILVEIEALGIQWCHVQMAGENEPLGYVNCSDIQRPTAQVSKAVHKQPIAIATPAAAVSAPVVLERRPEQPSAPIGGSIASVAPISAASTDALTNTDIVSMTKAGLPPEVLVAKIKSSKSQFDTSPASLSQLKSSGVADSVILAMVQAPTGGTTTAAAAQPVASIPVVTNAPPAPPTVSTSDGKTRVLVTDSQSWEMRGSSSAGGNANGWGASSYSSGGARPQTAEIIKTLNQRCPELIVTNNLAKADFVLTLDHEGGKGYLQRHNKIAVFNRDGDDIFSDSTRELGSAVKDACQAMLSVNK